MQLDLLMSLRGTLGDMLLAKLLGRSATSVRLYAKGQRPVPQLVALRLELVNALVYDLAGGYNSIGMRTWFDRPRVELGGRSPLTALGHDWQPTEVTAADVARLAAKLRGPG
jgi:hypothetical protein